MNPNVTKPQYSEHILPVPGPSLYQGSTVLCWQNVKISCLFLTNKYSPLCENFVAILLKVIVLTNYMYMMDHFLFR